MAVVEMIKGPDSDVPHVHLWGTPVVTRWYNWTPRDSSSDVKVGQAEYLVQSCECGALREVKL